MSAGAASGGNSGGGSAAENAYCSPGDVPSFGANDGPAILPNACVYTAMSGSPATGSIITVTAGSASDLQAKLTSATCGQTIKIPAVVAGVQQVYQGMFTIPALSCPTSNWVIVETDQIGNAHFVPEGTRATPAWVGTTSLPGRPSFLLPTGGAGVYMPKLLNNNTVLSFTAGASHWRFIGLELTTVAGTSVVTNLVNAQSVDHIIFDRVVSHGGNNSSWQSPDNITRNFYFAQTTYWAVINSYVGEAHCVANGPCNDSQAVGFGGPGKAFNNFLEASGETVFSGGGGPSLAAHDLEIRGNRIFKPVFWKSNDPSYFGTTFIVKNGLEFKDTNRALVEGNIIENDWGQQSDQFGQLVLLGAKNQSVKTFGSASSDGAGTLTALTGSTFPSNVVSGSCATASHCNVTYNGINSYQAQTWIDSAHITVSPAPAANSGATFTACQPGQDPSALVANVTVRYNILSHASRGVGVFEAPSDCGDQATGTNSISIHDDVLDDIDGAIWNLSSGACCETSLPWEILNDVPPPFNVHGVSIIHTTALSLVNAAWVGTGPSFGIGEQTASGGTISNLQLRDNISAAGLDWADKGVCTGSNTALANLQCWSSTFCFDHNVMATTTTGTFPGTANNPAWPGPGASPSCSFTTTGQQLPSSYAAIGFADLNGANGGDYHLCHTGTPGCNAVSPYVGTASDGTDPGANIDLVNQYTAGAR